MIRICLFVCLLCLSLTARAQPPVGDRQLLAGRDFGVGASLTQYRRPGNPARPVPYRQVGWLARYNPVSLLLKGTLLGYQRLMSQPLARSCPYQLTCSDFSRGAFEQYGLVKGVFLSADRIMRCNQLGLLDVPPVDIDPTTGTIIDSLSRYRR